MTFRNARQRKAVMAKLTIQRNGGYLQSVINPKGTKPPVYLAEPADPKEPRGWWVRLDKKPYTILSKGHMNEEATAIRLAKKGHKRVIIRD